MSYLKKFKEELEEELYLKETKETKEEEDEEEDEEEEDKQGRAYTYRETKRSTKGKAFNIAYEIDYKELKTVLDDAVPNISWTIPKVRETFKTIRKYVGFDDSRKSE